MDSSSEFTSSVVAGSELEQKAIEHDRAGDAKNARIQYLKAAEQFRVAVVENAPDKHPDIAAIVKHREQVLARAAYLEKDVTERSPVEDHIQAAQLTMQYYGQAQEAKETAGGAKRLAGGAALGALGGFVVLGSLLGGGVAVVGGAASGLYLTTRKDKVGDVARSAADGAIGVAQKNQRIQQKTPVDLEGEESRKKRLDEDQRSK